MNKKKIRRYLQELRYIVPTLYFNFHYLPFRQAIRLPIVRGCVKKSYCVMGGSPVRVLSENVMRDFDK